MRSSGITNAAPYASAPTVGAAGDTYWNTTESCLYVSNGTVWVKVGPNMVLRSHDYLELGRSSAALFTIAALPALSANQRLRLLVGGQLYVNSGTFTLSVKSVTGWTTAATLFFYGVIAGGSFRLELDIWQTSAGTTYSFSSLTHLMTTITPPASGIAANGQQAANAYQAATGAITVSGQFSASDASNVLVRLIAAAELL